MRQVFSVVMMILTLLVGFQQALIVLHFKLNQQQIAREWCINRDKPTVHCEGTCFLKRQLKEASTQETTTIKNYPRLDMLFVMQDLFLSQWVEPTMRKEKIGYKEVAYTAPYREIFVPPPITCKQFARII